MSSNLECSYNEYYKSKTHKNLWPTEFAVRALKGQNYQFTKSLDFNCALDLGFGDGRNIELLNSLYSKTHGLEISEEICTIAKKRFEGTEFIVGDSSNIPKEDSTYDLVLAVHSIYYCQNKSIENNFKEVFRVLKSRGRFIFSIPNSNSYLLKNATKLENEYAIVNEDPLKIRNGTIIKYFQNRNQFSDLLTSLGFSDINIGVSDNDWWGIRESFWIISCNKI